ncbi:MAG: copper amine oxidase N-terminal domain-containing protein [Clostridiales bacterium]|nr:copper amine oxidase N-terminal domain-containing protein [Clostridiales bacterium]
MKKRIHILFCALAAVLAAVSLTTTAALASSGVSAKRCTSQIYLNDKAISVVGYTIGGSNYFMIRDLAWALRDSPSCFDVTWNAKTKQVELVTRCPYTQGRPQSPGSSTAKAVPGNDQLTVDGKAVRAAAYTIGGRNYYRLRDLGAVLNFDVYWVQETRSICLYTADEHARMADATPASSRPMTASDSTARWSHLLSSYLYENDGDTFCVVDAKPNGLSNVVAVDTYDRETFALLSSRTVPVELDTFGGFFAGEKYNFMVFGQNNTEEDNQKEVIRVVKYDKDFQRLDAVSVTGGQSFTVVPFDAGSLCMAEDGDMLVIHTARERYTTADGRNHQSQLTICVDTGNMRVTNDLGRFQGNHVSHSFNQFVIFDRGQLVLADHGDAYPRSIVLSRVSGGRTTDRAFKTDLLKIPGSTGANCTGVTLGGLAASSDSYLVVINTIDHSKVTAYSSFSMSGLGRDERDVVLLVTSKGGSSTQQIRLTDYVGNGKLASTPYLVKVDENRFLVLWEEFVYPDASPVVFNQGVRYVEVDGSGEILGEVQTLPGARLSNDCQPILMDGRVTWYINTKVGRMFYQIAVLSADS